MNAITPDDMGGGVPSPASGNADAEYVLKLAIINKEFGNKKRAADLLSFAEWLAPNNPIVLRKLVHVFLDLGEIDLAAEKLRKLTSLIDSKKLPAEVLVVMARLLKCRGQYEQARGALRKLVTMR